MWTLEAGVSSEGSVRRGQSRNGLVCLRDSVQTREAIGRGNGGRGSENHSGDGRGWGCDRALGRSKHQLARVLKYVLWLLIGEVT